MVTFGFTLLVTDVAIMIMTYYSVIGGWITEYLAVYLAGQGVYAAEEGYFTSFITSEVYPIIFMLLFLAITAFIVYSGVEKGIERFARIVMPGLLIMIVGIAVYSLTLHFKDGNGSIRNRNLGTYDHSGSICCSGYDGSTLFTVGGHIYTGSIVQLNMISVN